MYDVKYKISTYPAKSHAYQSKKGLEGVITLYISNIWKHSKSYGRFVVDCIYYIILERVCLERGFQKIRMKNRCNPCKMEKYAKEIFLNNW